MHVGPASKKQTILYVERVHPEKGLNLLIEGFAEFAAASGKVWKLKIVGRVDHQAHVRRIVAPT